MLEEAEWRRKEKWLGMAERGRGGSRTRRNGIEKNEPVER
jgi:hypothetical protein